MGLEFEFIDMEFVMLDVNCDGIESGLRVCWNEYVNFNCIIDNYVFVFCINIDFVNSISML